MSWNCPTQHSGRPCSSRRKVRLASVQTMLAVRAHEALLALPGAELAVEDPPGGVDVALAVFGVRELLVADADQLVRRAPEHRAQRGVDAHVLTVRVEQRHADRHRVEGRVERSGRVAVELAQDAQQRAVGEDAHADVERERHAVRAPAGERDQRDRVSGGDAFHRAPQTRRIGDQLGEAVTAGIDPEHRRGRRARGQHEAVGVEHERGVRKEREGRRRGEQRVSHECALVDRHADERQCAIYLGRFAPMFRTIRRLPFLKFVAIVQLALLARRHLGVAHARRAPADAGADAAPASDDAGRAP